MSLHKNIWARPTGGVDSIDKNENFLFMSYELKS